MTKRQEVIEDSHDRDLEYPPKAIQIIRTKLVTICPNIIEVSKINKYYLNKLILSGLVKQTIIWSLKKKKNNFVAIYVYILPILPSH